MRIVVVPLWGGAGVLLPLADDGTPEGPPEHVADLAAAVGERELAAGPRWVWAAADAVYPALLRRGVRVGRCEDLALTEGVLLAADGHWGEPRSLAAAYARLRGLPVPDDKPPGRRPTQASLFEPDQAGSGLPAGVEPAGAVAEVHADQRRRIAAAEHPDRMALLVAAESAGALAAAEMGHEGMPWRADVHDALLRELLGPRPAPGARPERLRELSDRIQAAFGDQPVNPDSPEQVTKAFARAGLTVASTRSHVLREVDHPAAPLLLAYKELARVHVAHGWSWLETWVRDGRFRPEYVPGGVVSGRWATRGGGALQIPKAVRRAVVADPGWTFVVADASQLEPRILAALSADLRLARAAGTGDLYAALAAEFGNDRGRAKIALLAAMYGGTGGDAGQFLQVLRRRFPDAIGLVEAAARAGEEGRLVRSRLGRTSPPPSAAWRALTAAATDPDADPDAARRGRQAARSWSRFTRNFVVQATAADWALVLLAGLRRRLAPLGPAAERPRLVFFQHDEVVVHCPRAAAEAVTAAVTAAAEDAGRLLFGPTEVRFPLETAVVDCYADAK